MDESPQEPEHHDPHGQPAAPDYARPQESTRRRWMIPAIVGVVVLAVGGFFAVKALAGGGSSTSTAAQTPANGGGPGGAGRRGTVGTLQSIDGSTLTVATFNRGAGANNSVNNPGAAGGTTTVITNGSTKFYKTVSGSLSDVKTGDRVTAMGTPDGTTSLTAARITDTGTMTAAFGGPGGNGGGRRFRNGNGPNTQNGNGNDNNTPPPSNPNVTRPDPNSFASGTVKSISGTTLTVTQPDGTTKTVKTTGSTAFSVLKGVSISDLTTGQVIVVGGKMNSDGTVTANNVLEGVGGGGFGRFGGRARDGGAGAGGGGTDNPGNGTTTQ